MCVLIRNADDLCRRVTDRRVRSRLEPVFTQNLRAISGGRSEVGR
jgi:hypothetical protein